MSKRTPSDSTTLGKNILYLSTAAFEPHLTAGSVLHIIHQDMEWTLTANHRLVFDGPIKDITKSVGKAFQGGKEVVLILEHRILDRVYCRGLAWKTTGFGKSAQNGVGLGFIKDFGSLAGGLPSDITFVTEDWIDDEWLRRAGGTSHSNA